MQTNRRHFLTALSALAAGLVLDEVTGLFVPRKKLWQVGAAAPVLGYGPPIVLTRRDPFIKVTLPGDAAFVQEFNTEIRYRTPADLKLRHVSWLDLRSIGRVVGHIPMLPHRGSCDIGYLESALMA